MLYKKLKYNIIWKEVYKYKLFIKEKLFKRSGINEKVYQIVGFKI